MGGERPPVGSPRQCGGQWCRYGNVDLCGDAWALPRVGDVASALEPGASIGQTDVLGDYNLLAGQWNLEVDLDAATADFVNVTGTLDLDNLADGDDVLNISLYGTGATPSEDVYVLAQYNELVGTFDEVNLPAELSSYEVVYDYGPQGNQIALTFVPEPSSLLLILLGLLNLTIGRRRRRR